MIGLSARDWIRTSTTFRMLPPEDSASTNFATRAGRKCKLKKLKMESILKKCLHFNQCGVHQVNLYIVGGVIRF